MFPLEKASFLYYPNKDLLAEAAPRIPVPIAPICCTADGVAAVGDVIEPKLDWEEGAPLYWSLSHDSRV